MLHRSILSFIVASLAMASTAIAADVNFPTGKTCVAWKTKKRMFLLKNVEPVGISCDVTTIWTRENDRPRVQIKLAIASFNSGEAERDREVIKILKGDAYPDIIIKSEPLLASAVKDFADGKDVEIKAEIEVAGTKVQKTMLVRRLTSGGFARVEVKTAFKDFGIDPPSVGGGAVAKVSEHLELYGQIAVTDEVLKMRFLFATLLATFALCEKSWSATDIGVFFPQRHVFVYAAEDEDKGGLKSEITGDRSGSVGLAKKSGPIGLELNWYKNEYGGTGPLARVRVAPWQVQLRSTQSTESGLDGQIQVGHGWTGPDFGSLGVAFELGATLRGFMSNDTSTLSSTSLAGGFWSLIVTKKRMDVPRRSGSTRILALRSWKMGPTPRFKFASTTSQSYF